MKQPTYKELLKQLDALHEEVFREVEISDPRAALVCRTAEVMAGLRACVPEEGRLPHSQQPNDPQGV